MIYTYETGFLNTETSDDLLLWMLRESAMSHAASSKLLLRSKTGKKVCTG
jgi:hypothetical protein